MDSLVFIMFFLSLIGILIGLKGIITGKIKFLKVNTRKKASGVFIAFLILFFVSTILIPSTDEPFKTIENNDSAYETTLSDNVQTSDEKSDLGNLSEIKVTVKVEPEDTEETQKESEAITTQPLSNPLSDSNNGEMTIHFIDVGQGDATLLQGPNFTVLIDTGTHTGNEVVPYLKSQGVVSIDILIGTHEHADHIGQMDKVLKAFEVDEVWLAGNVQSTKTFERVLDAIEESGAGYHEPRTGEEFQVGDLYIQVIHPSDLTGNYNDDSIATRIQFGDIVLVFTGDTEKSGEQKILDRGYNIKAHILHVGHHGSTSSSTSAFLDAVSPEIAVYSAGEGNAYGHPHAEIIERLKKRNIKIYGTDIHGTVKVITDGKTYRIETEKNG